MLCFPSIDDDDDEAATPRCLYDYLLLTKLLFTSLPFLIGRPVLIPHNLVIVGGIEGMLMDGGDFGSHRWHKGCGT